MFFMPIYHFVNSPFRRVSVASTASLYSHTESTHDNSSTARSSTLLRPPKAPFSLANRISQFGNNLPLSVNYVPSKFSGVARFRGGKPHLATRLSRRSDIPEGDQARWASGSEKLRWNKFKWILFVSNFMVSVTFSAISTGVYAFRHFS